MNRIQISLINQAQEKPELLTDWESDFIDSIADREENYDLSEKQNEILNRIGGKVALCR